MFKYNNINFIVSPNDFTFYYKIGKCKFGSIYKVKELITGKYFALKQMTKARIIDKGVETTILKERNTLAKFDSPFVISLLCSFQDKNNLFFLFELLSGGDLQYHINHYNYYFTETQLKFFLTNIILGLEYIHKKGIVHCNLSPENIMFDSRGFAKIIGFGNSCLKDKHPDSKSIELDESPFMAPETIQLKRVNYTADFYSLGAIAYLLVKGKKYDIDKDEDTLLLKDKKLRTYCSEFCLDFISLLLKRNPKERLGSDEYEKELKKHDFLMGMRWDWIKKRIYKSPNYDIVQYSKIQNDYPELFDYDECNNVETEPSPEEIDNYREIVEGEAYPMYFQYFTSMKVENIARDLQKSDEGYYNDDLKPYKKIKKSQSSQDIMPDNQNKHHHHHFPREKIDRNNIYELPYINTSEQLRLANKKREKLIRDYYEDKLYKYKDNLRKLHNNFLAKSTELNLLQSKNLDPKKLKLLPMYPQPYQFPGLPFQNNFNFPPINQNQNKGIYDDKRMKKMMSRFYKKMSKDRDNFFIKYNKNNRLDKKKSESYSSDDYSSSYSSDSTNYGKRQYNYYDIPFYNPYNPNISYHNYFNMPGMNEQRRPRIIRIEEQSEDKTDESEESGTTSVRYIDKKKGKIIQRSESTGKNNKYKKNDKKSETEETEEEEDDDEDESESDEEEK